MARHMFVTTLIVGAIYFSLLMVVELPEAAAGQ